MSPLKLRIDDVEVNTDVRVNRNHIVDGFILNDGSDATLAIGELDPEMNVRGGMLVRPAREHNIVGLHDGGVVDGKRLDVGEEKKLERGVVIRGERAW